MRKSRYKLYNYAFLLILAINAILSFTIYRPEVKAVKDAYWENPWYALIGGVLLQGLLVAFLLLQTFEVGRKRGIKELGDDMLVDPDDYLDFDKDDKIMVTEKHSLDGKRRSYAIPGVGKTLVSCTVPLNIKDHRWKGRLLGFIGTWKVLSILMVLEIIFSFFVGINRYDTLTGSNRINLLFIIYAFIFLDLVVIFITLSNKMNKRKENDSF